MNPKLEAMAEAAAGNCVKILKRGMSPNIVSTDFHRLIVAAFKDGYLARDAEVGNMLTREEIKKAVEAIDGVCVFAAIHGINTPVPELVKLMEWLRAFEQGGE